MQKLGPVWLRILSLSSITSNISTHTCNIKYRLFTKLVSTKLVMPESQSLEERLGATKQVTDIVRAKEDADVGGAEHGVTGVEVGAAGV